LDKRTRGQEDFGQEYRRTLDKSTGELLTGVQEYRRTGVQGNGRTEGWGGRMEKRNGSTKNCESLCN
jgi:hypothetical protein